MPESVTVHIHRAEDDSLWADVEELPGVFATGDNMDELREDLDGAVSAYLSEPGHEVSVQLDVTEERALLHTA
jgi:predicted RNase H-like HicB family nuclease